MTDAANLIRSGLSCLVILLMSLLCAVSSLAQSLNGWNEQECLCMRPYAPICASDKRRYYNECIFQCRVQYLTRTQGTPIKKVDCSSLPPTQDNWIHQLFGT